MRNLPEIRPTTTWELFHEIWLHNYRSVILEDVPSQTKKICAVASIPKKHANSCSYRSGKNAGRTRQHLYRHISFKVDYRKIQSDILNNWDWRLFREHGNRRMWLHVREVKADEFGLTYRDFQRKNCTNPRSSSEHQTERTLDKLSEKIENQQNDKKKHGVICDVKL